MLHVAGSEADALVTINDRYVGKLVELSKRGIRLPAGTYRITIEQAGFFPYDEIITASGEPINIQATLVAIPD